MRAFEVSVQPSSEPDRSGGAVTSGGAAPPQVPDPEVPARPKRRQFTAEYERSILDQVEACRDEGATGALTRDHDTART